MYWLFREINTIPPHFLNAVHYFDPLFTYRHLRIIYATENFISPAFKHFVVCKKQIKDVQYTIPIGKK